jgi:hypothetical protein
VPLNHSRVLRARSDDQATTGVCRVIEVAKCSGLPCTVPLPRYQRPSTRNAVRNIMYFYMHSSLTNLYRLGVVSPLDSEW